MSGLRPQIPFSTKILGKFQCVILRFTPKIIQKPFLYGITWEEKFRRKRLSKSPLIGFNTFFKLDTEILDQNAKNREKIKESTKQKPSVWK